MSAEMWTVVLVGFSLLVSLLGYLELSRRATAKSTGRKFDWLNEKTGALRKELKEDIGALGAKTEALSKKMDTQNKALSDKIDEKTDSLRKEIKEDLKSLREDLAQTNQNLYDLNTRVSAALGLPAAEPADSSA